MSSGIYMLLDPVSLAIRYVGQTVNFQARKWSYSAKPPRRMRPVVGWLRKLRRDGLKPVFVPVLACADVSERDRAEIAFISHLRSLGCALLNLEDGGQGVTDADRQARAERMRARWQTPEFRTKMLGVNRALGDARKGKKASELTRAKMRGRTPWNKGRAPDDLTKNKIAETLRGRRLGEQHRQSISNGLKAAYAGGRR